MPCGPGLLARSRGQANLPKRLKSHMRSILPGHLGLAFKIGQPADLAIGASRRAVWAISGVRKLPPPLPADLEIRLPSLWRLPSSLTELPIGRARSSPHSAWRNARRTGTACVERLMDAMFLENVGRDERQLVNGLSEFRCHASRSNGHEADSGDGRGNLQRGRSDGRDFGNYTFSLAPPSGNPSHGRWRVGFGIFPTSSH